MTKLEFGQYVIQELVRRIEYHTPRGLIENDETDMECVKQAAKELYDELPRWMMDI